MAVSNSWDCATKSAVDHFDPHGQSINLLLMLCFGVQATLTLNLWSFTRASRTGGKVHSTVMRFHLLDEYANVIYASSRSQRIISTRWLPEMIREMKTVMLTGFIYSRLCDITAWISYASLNRFYKISGVISNCKFEFEMSKSAKVGRNQWGDITFKC